MKLCTAGASFLPNVPFVEHLNSQRMIYFHRILCFYYDSFLSLFIFFSCFFFSSLQSNLYAHFINAKFLFENFMACDKYSLFVNRSLAPSSSSSRYIIVYCHCNGELHSSAAAASLRKRFVGAEGREIHLCSMYCCHKWC